MFQLSWFTRIPFAEGESTASEKVLKLTLKFDGFIDGISPHESIVHIK